MIMLADSMHDWRIVLQAVLYSGITLYMMVLLLRWVAPYLAVDLYDRRWRWAPIVTDPILRQVRRILPPMGSSDWSAPAAVFLLWFLRVLLVRQ